MSTKQIDAIWTDISRDRSPNAAADFAAIMAINASRQAALNAKVTA